MTASAPVLMKPLRLRRLTPGEQALAHDVFGERIRPGKVRLLALPLWTRPFVAGSRLVVWPAVAARLDFADPATPLGEAAVFVHEMTHVWQAQNGVNLLIGKLKAGDRPSAYEYDLSRVPDFSRLNIEQQAMVVQHAFLQRRGGRAPYAAEAYAEVLPAWREGRGEG
jgi:hypothetical protein